MPLIERFLVVGLERDPKPVRGGGIFRPFIEASHPTDGIQVPNAEQFCFPDAFSFTVENFEKHKRSNTSSFVFLLTSGSGDQLYGFCRRILPTTSGVNDLRRPRCLALITSKAWFSVFPDLLERLEGVFEDDGLAAVASIVDILNLKTFDERRITHVVPLSNGDLIELQPPIQSENPLNDVPVVHLFKSLYVSHILKVFEGLLFEKRVIFVSKHFTKLSRAVFAAASLLYPFQWQHIFIPILPQKLLDVCCAPMPFCVGVHQSCVSRLRTMPLDHVLVVDLDNNRIIGSENDDPYDDQNSPNNLGGGNVLGGATPDKLNVEDAKLPSGPITTLRAALDVAVRNGKSSNRHLAAPFLHFFVSILAGYNRFFVRKRQQTSSHVGMTLPTQDTHDNDDDDDEQNDDSQSNAFVFDRDQLLARHTSRSCRSFLAHFCSSQMFEQFINTRLSLVESDLPLKSEFDVACIKYIAEYGDPISGDLNAAVVKQRMSQLSQAAGSRLKATWKRTKSQLEQRFDLDVERPAVTQPSEAVSPAVVAPSPASLLSGDFDRIASSDDEDDEDESNDQFEQVQTKETLLVLPDDEPPTPRNDLIDLDSSVASRQHSGDNLLDLFSSAAQPQAPATPSASSSTDPLANIFSTPSHSTPSSSTFNPFDNIPLTSSANSTPVVSRLTDDNAPTFNPFLDNLDTLQPFKAKPARKSSFPTSYAMPSTLDTTNVTTNTEKQRPEKQVASNKSSDLISFDGL